MEINLQIFLSRGKNKDDSGYTWNPKGIRQGS